MAMQREQVDERIGGTAGPADADGACRGQRCTMGHRRPQAHRYVSLAEQLCVDMCVDMCVDVHVDMCLDIRET